MGGWHQLISPPPSPALLGLNQPSASIGHILTQALKPATASPETPLSPKTTHRTRRGASSDKSAAPSAPAPSAPAPDLPGTDVPGGVTPP